MRLFIGDKHRRWHQDLSAYLDGQLEPHKQEALEGHLAQCASCQEELEALRGVLALLHRVPQAPAPRSFTLSREPARRVWWGTRYTAPLHYATAAAALLLLAVAIGDLVTGQPSLTVPEAPPSAERQEAQAIEEAVTETGQPAPAPDEPGTTDTLLRWTEVALGALLAALAALVAIQWWSGRRARAGH